MWLPCPPRPSPTPPGRSRARGRWWLGTWLAAAWLATVAGLGAGADGGAPGIHRAAEVAPAPPGLHRVFRLTGRIYSGSQPESEEALAGLARLGITTVVSVDGARPMVEAARRQGLRYIHLPVGYDGVSSNRLAQLARVATLPGVVYVHCHHGRHRGPAAAALLGRMAAGWSAEEGEAFLRQAGTAPEYAGLYRGVREFSPGAPGPPADVELPEQTPPPPVVEAMVEIDRLFESLKKLGEAGGASSPADGGGSSGGRPGRETAALLGEHFRELGRHPDTAGRPPGYRALLGRAETAAVDLQAAWSAAPGAGGGAGGWKAAVEARLDRLNQACLACHRRHRH